MKSLRILCLLHLTGVVSLFLYSVALCADPDHQDPFGAEPSDIQRPSESRAEALQAGLGDAALAEIDAAASEVLAEAERLIEIERGLLLKPTEQELVLGSAIAAFCFLATLFVLNDQAIEFERALIVAMAQGITAFIMHAGLQSFDRAFSSSWTDPSERVSATVEFWRRNVFNLLLLQAFRALTGATDQISAVNTIAGQTEVLLNWIAVGVGVAFVGELRNRRFLHEPEKSKWVNFNTFFPLALVSMMDFFGAKGIFAVQIAEIPWAETNLKLSTFIVLGSYLFAGLLIKFFPEKTQFEWQERSLETAIQGSKSLVSKVGHGIQSLCRLGVESLGRPTRRD